MPALDRLAYTGACKPSRRRRHAAGMRALVVLAAIATLGVVGAVARVLL
jgi:hypothetical protein